MTVTETARQSQSGSAAMPRPDCSAFPYFSQVCEVACACRGGASAPALSYQDKHTPRLQILIYINNSLSANLMCNIIIAGKMAHVSRDSDSCLMFFIGKIGDFRHR